MFRDRLEAVLLLAAKFKKYKNDPGVVLSETSVTSNIEIEAAEYAFFED